MFPVMSKDQLQALSLRAYGLHLKFVCTVIKTNISRSNTTMPACQIQSASISTKELKNIDRLKFNNVLN